MDTKNLNTKDYIVIKGAKVNNLKNISLAIPRNQLIVITGVSGSGKSSLAFDTLFAEGQRMYVESLSAYTRQFLGRMEKPQVDYIKGVCPAIAIEQKVNTKNRRSTVGTTTEIYDYLKLLYARIGKTYSPVSANLVKKDYVSDIVEEIYTFPENTKLLISAPLKIGESNRIREALQICLQKGLTRVIIADKLYFIEEIIAEIPKGNIRILIDRNQGKNNKENTFRLSDSIQTALVESNGICIIDFLVPGKEKTIRQYSDRFEADGIRFEEPSVNFFSFNNPYGACKRCEGFGSILDIAPDKVIPDKELSVYEGAIAPWRGESMSKKWLKPLIDHADHFDFPIHRCYYALSEAEKELLWNGNQYFKGLHAFFEFLASNTLKIQYRVMISRYRGRTVCPECKGTRLRKDAGYVKINGRSLIDLLLLSVNELVSFFNNLSLDATEEKIAKRLLTEIKNRLGYLEKVGLGYLNLNRLTATLSGGEYQRTKLSVSLGSALVGSMYILDEPSIGLHPRDTQNLIKILKELNKIGNTVIVVEHEEDIMEAAEQIIDIGPEAGVLGGELVFQGSLSEIKKQKTGHTACFLNGLDKNPLPLIRRKWSQSIVVVKANKHNLKNIQATFPLNTITAVTGVSGSGKSTLVREILQEELTKILTETGQISNNIQGDTEVLTSIKFVNQSPIGRSSRSNPVTYVKAYDFIRKLFAEQFLAKQQAYKPAMFSFNVDGGRCEECQGDGRVKIEMQFMADVYLNCEICQGKRFKDEILEITYQGKDIADVLDMTIAEGIDFFKDQPKILEKLQPLYDTGLGYICLGQSSNSLSGGEAQRVKLASFLVRGHIKAGEHILFIFDEPTTGLHFHDIKKLMCAINQLVENGHSVIIIEHNMEVVKLADWIIDLGPEGGAKGGRVCFEGTPEELIKHKDNHTARFLKQKFR